MNTNQLTTLQYRTLSIIAKYPDGVTMLLPMYWKDRHHQTLLKRGFLRLRADPFKTKASMLHGRITARGRAAVKTASPSVRARAKEAADRAYARYVRELEEGRHA